MVGGSSGGDSLRHDGAVPVALGEYGVGAKAERPGKAEGDPIGNALWGMMDEDPSGVPSCSFSSPAPFHPATVLGANLVRHAKERNPGLRPK